ncbi:MAG: hypothetical protein ACKPGI_02030, partial [Verrucomicrobiota bacterium]
MPHNFLTTEARSIPTLEVMKRFRPILSLFGVVAAFVAEAGEQAALPPPGAAPQPVAAELQSLQGTWKGRMVQDSETSKDSEASQQKPSETSGESLLSNVLGNPGKTGKTTEDITITISGTALHFHRDTNFWFKTTFTLPGGTNPKQLHATIKECPPSQADSVGQVVGAIYK